MGCGQKAVADDEDDWDSLCKLAEIRVNWDCYSVKARHAETGFRKLNLKNSKLLKYVDLMVAVDALYKEQQVEDNERQMLASLKKKYEK